MMYQIVIEQTSKKPKKKENTKQRGEKTEIGPVPLVIGFVSDRSQMHFDIQFYTN